VCLWFRFGLGFGGFFRRLCGFGWFRGRVVVFAAIELYLELFVEAKCLLPTLEFVARLLGFFFVRAKIEEHVGVGHRESLRCAQPQVKMWVALARFSWVLHDSLQTGNDWSMPRLL
jgi:hypothetical protein